MRKTVIGSEAFLIEGDFRGETFRILWGVIKTDETGRWKPGDYVCTTPIQKIEELGEGVTQFHTRSGSIYETTCTLTPHKPTRDSDWDFFRAGISPDELELINKLVRVLDEEKPN